MNLEVTLLLNGMNRTLLLPSANKLTNKKTRPVRFHPHEVLRVISVKETGSGRKRGSAEARSCSRDKKGKRG